MEVDMSIRLALRLSLCLIGLSMVVQADPKIDIKPDTTHIRDSLIKDKKFMKNVWKKVQKVNQEYRQYKKIGRASCRERVYHPV